MDSPISHDKLKNGALYLCWSQYGNPRIRKWLSAVGWCSTEGKINSKEYFRAEHEVIPPSWAYKDRQ
jgi:hypothetical protein